MLTSSVGVVAVRLFAKPGHQFRGNMGRARLFLQGWVGKLVLHVEMTLELATGCRFDLLICAAMLHCPQSQCTMVFRTDRH